MGTEKAEDRAQSEDGAMIGWSSWRSGFRKEVNSSICGWQEKVELVGPRDSRSEVKQAGLCTEILRCLDDHLGASCGLEKCKQSIICRKGQGKRQVGCGSQSPHKR